MPEAQEAPKIRLQAQTLASLQQAVFAANGSVVIDLQGAELAGPGPLLLLAQGDSRLTLLDGTLKVASGICVDGNVDLTDITVTESGRDTRFDAALSFGTAPEPDSLPSELAQAVSALLSSPRCPRSAPPRCHLRRVAVTANHCHGLWSNGSCALALDKCDVGRNVGVGIRVESCVWVAPLPGHALDRSPTAAAAASSRVDADLTHCKVHDNSLDQVDVSYGAVMRMTQSAVFCTAAPATDRAVTQGREAHHVNWCRAPAATDGRDGISIRSGAHATLTGCRLYHARAANVHVIRGTLEMRGQCSVYGAHGCNVLAEFERSVVHIVDSCVYDTVMTNVACVGGGSVHLTRSEVYGAVCNGVMVDGGRTFSGATGSGPASACVMLDCQVYGNMRNNVVATDKSRLRIEGGSVRDSQGYEGSPGVGVLAQGSGSEVELLSSSASRLEVCDNGTNVDVSNGAHVSATDIDIRNSTRKHGVSCDGGAAAAHLSRCTVSGSATDNVCVQHDSAAVLKQCLVTDARSSGAMVVFQGARLTASDCRFVNNEQHHIAVAHGASATVTECMLQTTKSNHGLAAVGVDASLIVTESSVVRSGGAAAAAEAGGSVQLRSVVVEDGQGSCGALLASGAQATVSYDGACRIEHSGLQTSEEAGGRVLLAPRKRSRSMDGAGGARKAVTATADAAKGVGRALTDVSEHHSKWWSVFTKWL